MSSSRTATVTMSRAEYERCVHRGLAGPAPMIEDSAVITRWRADHPDWRGRYWAYTETDDGVLRLRPLNVARTTRSQAAA
ncbi:hypothetical protein NDR87_13690 [Nocardia sp. CDC159]|uniref:Uncharacterized protein n=1 Tax=Nocardia pulmonis TaxID=2951408 RepID=A0A9X2E7Y9_9NOCA|nr:MULTISPECIES: hypothetical protein [Nocardia]MCM6774525.1 hypothetical protein [Nocardia pulmonis]MCM6787409.1 hypothetical protein [Nocardia sp. CDC159]